MCKYSINRGFVTEYYILCYLELDGLDDQWGSDRYDVLVAHLLFEYQQLHDHKCIYYTGLIRSTLV